MIKLRLFRAVLLGLGLAGMAAGQTVTLTNVSPNPATPLDSVFFTAQVTGTPGATVTFLDNGTVFATVASDTSTGTAFTSQSGFSVGVHTITATIPGAASSAVNLIVRPNLTSSPNPSTYCSPVVLTGVPPIGSEANSVTFTDGQTVLGTVPLVSGAGSLTTSTLTAGSHTLGASAFVGATSFATLVQVVNRLTPTVTLVTAPNPSLLGQTVSMFATVGSCNATGTITFMDGVTPLGTVQMANGSAVLTTSRLAAGQHLITAQYSGDANNNSAVSSAVAQVVGVPTILFTATPSPASACQPVTLSATIVPPDIPSQPVPARRIPGPPATGTVTFRDGNTTLGTVPIVAGTATLQTTLPAGNRALTAVYSGDQNYASVSASITEVVNAAVPVVTLTSAPNPSFLGQAVTMTATVTGCTTPTGAVTFHDRTAAGDITTVFQLVNGVATQTTTGLTLGNHTLTAHSGGDSNNSPADSNTVIQVVGKLPSTTTVTANPNPSTSGQTIVLTATVAAGSGASGVPTGSVTFSNGSTQIGSAALNAAGVATVSVSNLPAGTYPLAATYSGDTTFAGSSGTVTVTVKSPTTTTVSFSANNVSPGQAVTVTATVTPSGATGQVTFFDNGANIGSATLANGSASIRITPTGGVHTVTATYAGDANFQSSTSPPATLTVLSPVTITFTASPNPANAGQAITLTARLSSTTAIGVVTFEEGAKVLGVAGLSNGVATATVSTLTVGTHTITANFAGDSTTAPASASLDVTVNKASTTTSVSASPTSVPPGGAVTLTARVNPSGATGTVTFSEAGQTLGTASLTNGVASIQATFTNTGTHTVTASYGGDANFQASASSPFAVAVGLPLTTTTLTSTPASPVFGQAVVLTATVAPPAATGSVTFTEGATTLGTATLSGGSASITTSGLAVGSHALTATYGGDTNNAGSSGSATVAVGKAQPTISLVASPSPATVGQPVTITATITPSAATGTITFSDGGTTLGTATLNNGSASLTTSALVQGPHSLSAAYGGDGNFLGGSGQASLTVNPPALTISGPASIPNGTVGQAYPPQTITATGGTLPYTWSILASGSSTTDLTIANVGNDGSLTGTPRMAGNFTITVQVRDSASPPATASRTYNVTFAFPPLPPITVSSTQVTFSQPYPLPLKGTLTLTFAPNASNLPPGFVNKQLLFQNGTNTTQIDIPANSTAPVAIPPFQQGSVAGTITVSLTGVSHADTGQAVTPFPSPAPLATITIARSAPVIDANSVKIINVTGTGFQVTFNGTSNTRDLVRADLTFTAPGGTTLTGSQTFQSDLSAGGNTWFGSTDGQNGGGTFSVTIPFSFSGDARAIPTSVTVTVTNSAGTSASATGGR
jgi:hypothetical protein